MKNIGVLVLLSCFLTACSGPEEDYMAVYQVVPDAHMLYLGDHRYIAGDNDGNIYYVKVSEHGEATSVEPIF